MLRMRPARQGSIGRCEGNPDATHDQQWVDEQEIYPDIAFTRAEDARLHQVLVARVQRPDRGQDPPALRPRAPPDERKHK